MSTSALIAPAAQDEIATLFVGFELSKATWLIGLYSPQLGKTISRYKLDGGDINAALERITVARLRLEKLGEPVRVFNNRRELASYFGLPPSPYNSGSMRVDQGISKAGNPRARRLAIEIAWLWIRHQPNSALSKWFAQRVGEAKGRIRRIAVVALARKLMVALWRYLETGLIPEGAVMNAAS